MNLYKLADNLKKNKALEELQIRFLDDFKLKPVIGGELEFYLNFNLSNNYTVHMLEEKIKYSFQKEKGVGQFEVNFNPSENLSTFAYSIENFKLALIETLQNIGSFDNEFLMRVFHSKPFIDDYGSALHIHLNFIDEDGNNACDNSSFTNLISSSLCHYLNETFLVFAPNEYSYLRFDAKFMAPTNISFGGNNRTTAIRIPDSYPKRIEHRVAGADADPYLAIFTILKAIYNGLSKKSEIPLIEKLYGNAYDKQYSLLSFPKNKNMAEKVFNTEFFNLGSVNISS